MVKQPSKSYTVLTVADATALVDRLEHLERQLFNTTQAAQIDQALRKTLSAEEYQFLTEAAVDDGVIMNDTTAWRQFLVNIRTELSHLPLVRVHLAFLPRQAFRDDLVEWFAANGPGPCRLDITSDPTLLGGMVIESAGRIHDFSLRERISDYVPDLPQLPSTNR